MGDPVPIPLVPDLGCVYLWNYSVLQSTCGIRYVGNLTYAVSVCRTFHEACKLHGIRTSWNTIGPNGINNEHCRDSSGIATVSTMPCNLKRHRTTSQSISRHQNGNEYLLDLSKAVHFLRVCYYNLSLPGCTPSNHPPHYHLQPHNI